MIQRIKELVDLLNRATDAYYNSSNPILTDYEFDSLMEELKNLEKSTGYILSNSPTVNVGYEVHNKFPKFKHNIQMLSLDKITTIDEIRNFIGNHNAIMSLKEDGLSIRLIYDNNGDLKVVATRGTGSEGSDITNNLCTFTNIPTHIITNGREFIIDGEAICTFENLNRLNQNLDIPYKHPRSVASGSVLLLDQNEARNRKLQFIAWKFTKGSNSNSYGERLNELTDFGFDVVPWCNVDTKYIEDSIKMLQKSAKMLSHPYDGIVISYDDIAYGESLSSTSKFPYHSKAYKFAQDAEETVIRNFEFSIGRTGQLTPVACFDNITLDGTDVSRCSCHNISYCKNMKLGIGATVKVIKAMQIIPQIVECVEEGEPFQWPNTCPICGAHTTIKNDNESEILICTNSECNGKLIGKLNHFVSKQALNIDGLSENTIKFLINKGWVKKYADLYHLSKYAEEWGRCEGFGKKSVNKIIMAIEKSRSVDLAHYIVSLSIPNIGSSAAKAISKKFNGSHYDFVQALSSGYDFSQIDDFGEITNKSLHDWWDSKDPMIELLPMEMNFIVEEEKSVADNPFIGKNICVTGKLEHFNRDSINEKITSLGAKVASGVTSKTDFLITNTPDSGSSKNVNAKKFGTKIITEKEFLKIIGQPS